MKKVAVFLLIVFFMASARSQPLPANSKQTIIIDTDCAIDDFRALNLILSQTSIEVEAIIASEGSVNPENGTQKIRALLHQWGADSIPIIIGKEIWGQPPAWQEFNKNIEWGRNAIDIQEYTLDYFKKPIDTSTSFTLLCMGTLTTADVLKKDYPDFFKKITRIVWYSSSVYPPGGFNYNYDKNAADEILQNPQVRIDVVSNLDEQSIIFDNFYLNIMKYNTSKISEIMLPVHLQPSVKEKLDQNHFVLADELSAIYLLNPELFYMTIKLPDTRIRHTQSYNREAVKEVITDILSANYINEKNVVFNAFPANRQMFNYDVRQIMDSAILKYGKEEWKACVITDEFHGHLGVFSIVGAKMGIKAREIFGVGPDELKVVTQAGTVPPYSCLNDGIQVSTGATLGQGTIKVSSDSITSPEAVFSYKGKSVKISLKKEYLEIINRDIREGIIKFGLADDGYWKLVRQSALKYWIDWDRNKIFTINPVN